MVGISGLTPIYAAPEMFMKKQMSEKSDVFSCSIIMWQMIFQQTPFLDLLKGFMGYMPGN